SEDTIMQALGRICTSLDGAGVAGKGTSAALREMSSHWKAADGKVDPAMATSDIEKALAMLEKVRKALFKQTEATGPIKLAPTKLGHSMILSENARLPLGTIRVSDMNFGIPRAPETEKIMISILKGTPGKYKKAAMEIFDGRAGMVAWHEKNVGAAEKVVDMPIKDLVETVAAAMYHLATVS
ncbi:MAG: hypothetical protein VB032_09570, partial [Burkholderiaceae bacterium]|nr:hypothetical protein [Burkholderiaceae bacterium]